MDPSEDKELEEAFKRLQERFDRLHEGTLGRRDPFIKRLIEEQKTDREAEIIKQLESLTDRILYLENNIRELRLSFDLNNFSSKYHHYAYPYRVRNIYEYDSTEDCTCPDPDEEESLDSEPEYHSV